LLSKRALTNLSSALLALLLAPPLDAAAQTGRCVASVCADGYQGCGCGAESEECCRRRMTGDGSKATGEAGSSPDTALFDQMMRATLQKSLNDMQTQQERVRQQQLDQQRQIQQQHLRDAQNSEDERMHLQSKQKRLQEERTQSRKLQRKSLAEELGWDEEVVPGFSLDSLATDSAAGSAPASMGEAPEAEASGLPLVECAPRAEADSVHTCHTLSCGGTDRQPICCPRDHPYLSHCDCQCYGSRPEVDCVSYSACQYDYRYGPE
jgi:hypothetical protein